MGTVLNSYDNLLASVADNGEWPVFYSCNIPSNTTAANSTSGLVTAQRFPRTITVPSLGAGLTGWAFPTVNLTAVTGGSNLFETQLCGLETLMGTLTVSGNSFADGAAMPTKTVKGTSLQTCAEFAFLVATTVLTATTPVVTITYTNQSGATNKTATLTLPTSPTINSAFLINPHLASGDTGIQDITNMSISTGSAGVLKVFGVLALSFGTPGSGQNISAPDPYTVPMIPWIAAAGDLIGFYDFGAVGAKDMYAHLVGVADN